MNTDVTDKIDFADVNGDGKQDLVAIPPANRFNSGVVYIGFSQTDNIDTNLFAIKKIILPSGATITPTYTPAPQVKGAINPTDSTYPNISNASTRNLVTSLDITDGNGNTYTTTYEYHNGKLHTGYPEERQGLGFEWIKKTNPDGTSTKVHYNQEDALQYARTIKRIENYGSDDLLYRASETTYAVEEFQEESSNYHSVNFIKKMDSYDYNFNGVNYSDWDTLKGMGGVWITHKNFDYDENGNRIRILDEGNISDPSDDVLTISSYIKNSSNYIFAPEYKKVYSYGLEESNFNQGSLESPNNLASYVDYYYDGIEVTRMIGDYGFVTKEVFHSGEDDQEKYPDSIKGYTHDVYGNVETITDGRGNTTTFYYDSNFHSNLISTKNAYGQIVETIGYDSLMRPIYKGDMNGNYTWNTYDEFGRVIEVSDGSSSAPQTLLTRVTYSDTAAPSDFPQWHKEETYLPENPNNYLEKYTYFDGLGRILQEKQETLNDSGSIIWMTVDYHYDIASGVERVSEPYESTISSFNPSEWNTVRNETVYYRDEIGRVKQVDYFHGVREYTQYGIADKTVLTFNSEDPNESQIYYEEISSRTRTTYSYPKGSYTLSSINGFDKTSWCYRTFSTTARNGLIIQEISSEDYDNNRSGNTITTLKDNLGRKKSYDDPDMGLWTYTYDENGNLMSQVDAKGNVLTFEYDALNRVKIKNGDNIVHYNYDGMLNDRSSSDGKNHGPLSVNGLLTSISFYGGSYEENYYYDFNNDIYKIEKTIDGMTRTYENTLDEIGRVTNEVLPGSDRESLFHSYNAAGQIKTLNNNSGTDYISNLSYNILGKVKGFSQGNGSVTEYTYNGKYRLTNINITGSQELIADMNFTYDAYGNLGQLRALRTALVILTVKPIPMTVYSDCPRLNLSDYMEQSPMNMTPITTCLTMTRKSTNTMV